MKIYEEKSLRDFEFWSGAKCRAEVLTPEELDQIEAIFEEIFPDGMSDTAINDVFWFEEDWVAEMLGFEDFEALERHHNGDDDDDDDDEDDDEDDDDDDEE